MCGIWNESFYGECMRHLDVRIGKHIGLSPLTRKQNKPKNRFLASHLLLCNHSTPFVDFSILMREQKVFTWIERKPVNNER